MDLIEINLLWATVVGVIAYMAHAAARPEKPLSKSVPLRPKNPNAAEINELLDALYPKDETPDAYLIHENDDFSIRVSVSCQDQRRRGRFDLTFTAELAPHLPPFPFTIDRNNQGSPWHSWNDLNDLVDNQKLGFRYAYKGNKAALDRHLNPSLQALQGIPPFRMQEHRVVISDNQAAKQLFIEPHHWSRVLAARCEEIQGWFILLLRRPTTLQALMRVLKTEGSHEKQVFRMLRRACSKEEISTYLATLNPLPETSLFLVLKMFVGQTLTKEERNVLIFDNHSSYGAVGRRLLRARGFRPALLLADAVDESSLEKLLPFLKRHADGETVPHLIALFQDERNRSQVLDILMLCSGDERIHQFFRHELEKGANTITKKIGRYMIDNGLPDDIPALAVADQDAGLIGTSIFREAIAQIRERHPVPENNGQLSLADLKPTQGDLTPLGDEEVGTLNTAGAPLRSSSKPTSEP